MSYNTLVNHEYKFILFWNPKVACSYLKRWYLHSIGIRAVSSDPKDLDGSPIFSGSLNEHKFIQDRIGLFSVKKKDIARFCSYKKIVVIRDPVDRLISFYRDKVILNRWSQADPRRRSNRLSLFADDSRNVISSRDVTFEMLTQMVQDIDDNDIGDHLIPQATGLMDLKFEHIINISASRNLARSLAKITGIKMKNVLVNKTDGKSEGLRPNSSFKECHKRTAGWFLDNLVYPRDEDLRIPHIERAIYKRYSKDYLKFERHIQPPEDIRIKLKIGELSRGG